MSEMELKYKFLTKMIKKLINKKGTYVNIESLKEILDLLEEIEGEKENGIN